MLRGAAPRLRCCPSGAGEMRVRDCDLASALRILELLDCSLHSSAKPPISHGVIGFWRICFHAHLKPAAARGEQEERIWQRDSAPGRPPFTVGGWAPGRGVIGRPFSARTNGRDCSREAGLQLQTFRACSAWGGEYNLQMIFGAQQSPAYALTSEAAPVVAPTNPSWLHSLAACGSGRLLTEAIGKSIQPLAQSAACAGEIGIDPVVGSDAASPFRDPWEIWTLDARDPRLPRRRGLANKEDPLDCSSPVSGTEKRTAARSGPQIASSHRGRLVADAFGKYLVLRYGYRLLQRFGLRADDRLSRINEL
ncbi:hypothetical protein CPLU01_00885 [Colletotrichum plurivorum]|uniref:Uncharacterized protein n=1 Tax=Colletotrichum plurivorum TaxID=2175906 RepID=A0A8H6NQW7_9PEZI|nr:hypothetical protein CPLU01_00885 [Colletotrichum plurivorum]